MKNYSFFISLLMLLAISIPSAWAEDEVYKTALFGSSYNSKGVSSYTASWSSTNDGFTVDIVNANNNNNGWNYIKTGNKNSTSIGSIITASLIDKAVTKVDVTIDAVTASSVNNITLYTSSDKSSWTKVSEYVVAKGTPSVSVSTPTANLYYKIDFDCKKGSSNGIVTISKVEYYISSSGDTPQPTIPVEQVQLNKSEITLEVDETETLTPTITPANATNTNVSWETSNSAVATIANGVIKAVSAGDATITCKSVADPTKSATCAVHVNPSPYTKSTLIFTAACGGSGTANDDAVWTVTSDGEESTYDATSGIHFGTNNKSVTYLQLATSDIEGTVARVVVNVRDAQAKATISVSVGGDNFSCADPAATNTSSDFSFTGSGSGEIIVRVDRGSSMTKALYVKSIVVYYIAAPQKDPAGLAYADLSKLVKLDGAFTAPTLTNPNSLEVTYTSDNTTVAEVTSNGAVTIKAAGKAVITASSEETENYKAGSASYTIYVVAHAGTQADPYTVADARLAIDCGAGVSGVYATGIVSQIVTAYNAKYGNITYNFSTDGQTTSDQLQAFRGKAKDGENFTSADDVKVGDEVVVKGDLTKYNSTYEFAADNQLYSLTRNKEDAGLAYETEEVEKTVGDDAFVNALTNPNSVPVTYESSNANVAEIANDGTVTIKAQGSATISATFAGDETYKPATVTYTITVNPASEDTRKTAQDIDGFDAINGNLNNDISFASNQGDGTAAPNLKDGSIQYYQPGTGKGSGGYMTITAVKGCKIDQVKVVIATNATSIKYSKDDGDLSEATEVETGADYLTPAALNAQTVNIYCAGADKNHRLFIAQVVVYYTGEPVAVDHLILSGEYQTEFVQGDEFNHDGLIVSAAYDAQGSETVDVTAQAVVTAPDMSSTGEKTVTVSFGGKDATYTINVAVNTDLDDLSGTWALVTDASQLVAGKKVIIAEAVEIDGKVNTMGVQNNNNRAAVASTAASGILTPNAATKTFTLVDAGNSKWALQGTDSKYLYAASSNSNYLKSQDKIDNNATWTICIENSKAAITANGTNIRNIIRFNSTSSLFSCYESGQSDIALYIQQQEDTPVVPEPDYTRSITAGQFGTICLPNSGRIEDATIFEIAHTKDGKIFFDEISEATMVAGRPYIFYPNNGANELKVYYTGSENAAAGSYNGLYGSYVQSQLTQNDGNYILYDNKYYLVDSEAYVGANRAYIKLGEVSTEEQAPAPGRRRVSMDVQGEQVATSIINTHYSDQPMKVMIDNQLYIIRAGQMFDMTGNKIK